jgi:hypothetical protein
MGLRKKRLPKEGREVSTLHRINSQKANGGACGATASERGAVCVIMKNMLPNSSASSVNVENISARPQRRLRPSLHIKMPTPFLCVASCDEGCCALIKHVDVHRHDQDAAFRPWV